MLTIAEQLRLEIELNRQEKEAKMQPRSKAWAITTLPSFAGKKALVCPGAFYGAGVELMAAAGFGKANTVEEADVVVFMGGVDLDPKTYGEEAIPGSGGGAQRDAAEKVIYELAQQHGKVCFGICRGAQFLHAMNGGKLWQDVNNHGGKDHVIYDLDDDVEVLANSYHHQMLMDGPELEIVAVCRDQIATKFKAFGMTVDLKGEGQNQMAEMEIEAGAYNKTRCFFVQGHPEVGCDEYRSWSLNKLKDYMIDWMGEGVTRDKHGQLSINEQLDQWRAASTLH